MSKEDIEEIKKQLSLSIDSNYGYGNEDDVHTISLKWGDEVLSVEVIYTSSN